MMSQMLSIVSPVGRVLCCLLGLTLSGGAGLWALADGEYLLQFDQVLWNKRRSEARPLFVEVVKRENVWLSTCFGHAPTYNKGEYAGVVTPITAPSPGQEALRIELPVQDDYWVPGGAFAATVVLEAIADGHHGSFVGTWRDHAINGVLQVPRRAPPPADSRAGRRRAERRRGRRRGRRSATKARGCSAAGKNSSRDLLIENDEGERRRKGRRSETKPA